MSFSPEPGTREILACVNRDTTGLKFSPFPGDGADTCSQGQKRVERHHQRCQSGAIYESSGITLTDSQRERHRWMESYNDSAPGLREREGAGPEAGNRCDISNGPRIRLRVSQPKITLRLRLQDMNQRANRQI